eukprot:10759821-Ditylum_brightwellii.AAC.1
MVHVDANQDFYRFSAYGSKKDERVQLRKSKFLEYSNLPDIRLVNHHSEILGGCKHKPNFCRFKDTDDPNSPGKQVYLTNDAEQNQ